MPKRLQKSTGPDGETSPINEPNHLILDGDYAEKVAEFIKTSKHTIDICAYAWRWYEVSPEIDIQKLNVHMLQALGRGVRVRALVDGYKMFEFYRGLGFSCKYVERTRMLHAKAICVDRKTLVVGSHNLTKRANTDNFEISVVLQDNETIEQFDTYFTKMWAVANAS